MGAGRPLFSCTAADQAITSGAIEERVAKLCPRSRPCHGQGGALAFVSCLFQAGQAGSVFCGDELLLQRALA